MPVKNQLKKSEAKCPVFCFTHRRFVAADRPGSSAIRSAMVCGSRFIEFNLEEERRMFSFLVRRTPIIFPLLIALTSCGSDDDNVGSPSDSDAGDTPDGAGGTSGNGGDAGDSTPDGGGGDTGDASLPDGGDSDAQTDAGATSPIGDILEGEHAGDQFGGTGIALSADGSRIVIGGALNDDVATNAGHARVFERDGDGWTQLGVDIDGEAADDRFGSAVAISDDGSRIAVGSYLNDGTGNGSGHVRVFDYVNGAWTQVGADIDGPNASAGAGAALGLSADGKRVVIGGPGVGSVDGVVTVYEETNGVWAALGTSITGNRELGTAVSISDDGSRIALSLPSAQSNAYEGTTRVYDWDNTAWVQVGADIVGEALGDFSGGALSFSGDGNTLAIGADNNLGLGTAGGGVSGGQVRVFQWATGAWTQIGQDLDGEPGERLGTAVAISADGTRLMAGGVGGGIARFYTFAADSWTEVDTFVVGSRTGSAVAISADGTVGAVGAEYYAGTQGNASGGVRVYALP
jgi:hypothetical protein